MLEKVTNEHPLLHRIHGGKCVKKYQILTDGAATIGRELALGKKTY
jgi:hypothetical protein